MIKASTFKPWKGKATDKHYLKIPKGTKDIFGEDAEKKILIECIVTEIMRSYNFKPSFTPVFEFTELFVRGIGKSTDIVKKEMYTFQDRGGRQLTLRPEGTAPIARLYIMNKLDIRDLPGLTRYAIRAGMISL